ncbi:hypothetical protein WSM22_22700 [Cytophagales bacterium WSM2-2]|nr:hypothetical protein WSM22_22700 [Cytophagales bacterium WSM2-2]
MKPNHRDLRSFYLLLLFTITITSHAQHKNVLIETTYKCSNEKLPEFLASSKQLKVIKESLVSEGKLVHFSDLWSQNEKEIVYETYLVASSREQYNASLSEFEKRARLKSPEALKVIKEVCRQTFDTLKNMAMLFPLIKSDFFAGVIGVENIDERPDPKLTYNIIADFTAFAEVDKKKFKVDSLRVNWGLSDVGRILNLHVAEGIPPQQINMVLAVHGMGIYSLLNNEAYREKYKTDNPNLTLIDELSRAGVKFMVCGQAMTWFGVKKEELVPQAKLTLTAQTTLTSHQLKNYALVKIKND